MNRRTFYNEVLTEHNRYPANKRAMEEPFWSRQGTNPSCGDDIVLKLKIEDGVIADGTFEGTGCAISQASLDIMLDLIRGKTVEEAAKLREIFLRMIQGEITEEEEKLLGEAAALKDVSHMPARVRCATLGWRTLGSFLEEQ